MLSRGGPGLATTLPWGVRHPLLRQFAWPLAVLAAFGAAFAAQALLRAEPAPPPRAAAIETPALGGAPSPPALERAAPVPRALRPARRARPRPRVDLTPATAAAPAEPASTPAPPPVAPPAQPAPAPPPEPDPVSFDSEG